MPVTKMNNMSIWLLMIVTVILVSRCYLQLVKGVIFYRIVPAGGFALDFYFFSQNLPEILF